MAAINPTQLTPPRVALIDERSGAISREWYRFFLSLLTAVEGNQEDTTLDPDASAGIASLQSALDSLSTDVNTLPRPELGTMAALQQANLPWLTFNTAPSPAPAAVGSVYWDGGTTVGVRMTPNVLGRVNEDLFYYIKASAAITKGQVIMFDGAVGASGVMKGKPATGVANGALIMGIAAESIANNGFGLVQLNGSLRGIDTSAFSDGDILWYDPAVAGGLTKTEPVAPNVKVQLAAVTHAAANGSLVIRVTAGSVLGGTDSNVKFGTLANKDMIQYDSTAQYWKNVTPATVKQVLGPGPKALSIYQPSGSENVTMFYTSVEVTFSNIRAVLIGTTPSVTYSVKSGADRSSATTTHVNAATVTSTTTGSNAAIANAVVPAGSWIWVETSAISGTVTFFSISMEF